MRCPYLVVGVEQGEHVAALHGHLARRLLRVVVQRHHALLARHVHHGGLLLLQIRDRLAAKLDFGNLPYCYTGFLLLKKLYFTLAVSSSSAH